MSRHHNNPLPALLAGGGLLCGAYYTLPYLETDWQLLPVLLAFFALVVLFKATLTILFFVIPQIWRYLRIWRVKNKIGSAGWSTPRDMRKAKFHKRTGFFVGAFNKCPVFVDIESSGLVHAPAGGGKTRDFVVPNLLQNPISMIVPDLKGTLICMTAKARAKYFKHDIIALNPAGLYEDVVGASARYNPLQILIDSWKDPAKHKHLFPDARSIAKQLSPDPKALTDNQYFRNGTSKFMVFAFMRLVTTQDNPNLTKALELLSDVETLEHELIEAACEDILSGDLARLAKDILAKMENGDPKQIESFREGAVQALEVFSSSGALSENTSHSDFRFSDLRHKKKRKTVYIIADPTNQEVYAPWIGLLSWCAITELIRNANGVPVCFMCDEINNFRINNLPKLITLAREFKIIMWLIVQELEEWANTYGRESLETLLSQTEAKIFMSATNLKTCELISRMLGDKPQMNLNHNLGSSFFDPVTRSLSEGARRLMTADEIRRSPKIILIYRKLNPIKITPIGYHQITPIKHRAGINPLFGKRFKGWTKIRL